MALFKMFDGTEEELEQVQPVPGRGYLISHITEDIEDYPVDKSSGKLFFDIEDDQGIRRVQTDALTAEGLIVTIEDGEGNQERYYIDAKDLALKEQLNDVLRGQNLNGLLLGQVDAETGEQIVSQQQLEDGKIVLGAGANGLRVAQIAAGGLVFLNNQTGDVSGLKGIGALYALENGVPAFGKLPVSVGGTSGSTKEEARQNLGITEEIEKVTTSAKEFTLSANGWVASETEEDKYKYVLAYSALRCGKDGNVPPIITYTENAEEYSKIERADATPQVGITFITEKKPEENIKIIVIDNA